MLISTKKLIIDQLTKNLLSAHKRIADTGNASEIIRISKYIFKLANQREDILTELIPEDKEQRGGGPV